MGVGFLSERESRPWNRPTVGNSNHRVSTITSHWAESLYGELRHTP
jgi:hypothetical protein